MVDDYSNTLFLREGVLDDAKIRILTHPHPRLMYGRIEDFNFDFDSGELYFKLRTTRGNMDNCFSRSSYWPDFGTGIRFTAGQEFVSIVYDLHGELCFQANKINATIEGVAY